MPSHQLATCVQCQGFKPSFIYNFEKQRIPEKHRSMVLTKYRLEAYATFTPSPRFGGSEVMVFSV
jgi:hypothetical protein